jgi:hypothetical protein
VRQKEGAPDAPYAAAPYEITKAPLSPTVQRTAQALPQIHDLNTMLHIIIIKLPN